MGVTYWHMDGWINILDTLSYQDIPWMLRDNMERIRSHQLEYVSTNADPVGVNLTITQPNASEIYYGACSKIDRHNRCLQESLDIEKKLQKN